MDISNLTNHVTDTVTSSTGSNWDKNNYANASDEELMDACKEFESYLWEMVVKEMTKSINLGMGEDSSTSTMVDYYKDQVITDLASEITDSTSSSLAQTLYEQMKRTYE